MDLLDKLLDTELDREVKALYSRIDDLTPNELQKLKNKAFLRQQELEELIHDITVARHKAHGIFLECHYSTSQGGAQ
jgi:hypothetical protein